MWSSVHHYHPFIFVSVVYFQKSNWNEIDRIWRVRSFRLLTVSMVSLKCARLASVGGFQPTAKMAFFWHSLFTAVTQTQLTESQNECNCVHQNLLAVLCLSAPLPTKTISWKIYCMAASIVDCLAIVVDGFEAVFHYATWFGFARFIIVCF